MVCPMKCIWGCCKCLFLFWRICLTISLPRESFLVVYQRSDHITEERWQVCLGGTRWLQAHNSAQHGVKDFDPGLCKLLAACHQWFDQTQAELQCKGRIDLKQLALCPWGPSGVINLDQSKAFDIYDGGFRDHWIQTEVLQMDQHSVPQWCWWTEGAQSPLWLSGWVVGLAGLLTLSTSLHCWLGAPASYS